MDAVYVSLNLFQDATSIAVVEICNLRIGNGFLGWKISRIKWTFITGRRQDGAYSSLLSRLHRIGHIASTASAMNLFAEDVDV